MDTNNTKQNPEDQEVIETLEKTAIAFSEKASEIDRNSTKIASLESSMQELANMYKSDKDHAIVKEKTELEIKKAELEKKEQALLVKEERINLGKSMNIGSSLDEVELVKSDKKELFLKTLKQNTQTLDSLRKKDTFLGNEAIGEHLAENMLNQWVSLSKTSTYSSSSNPMGGYAVRPQYMPTVDITNYTNEEKLLQLFGVTMVDALTIKTDRIDYDFNTETNNVKDYMEGQVFAMTDATPIYKPMTVELHEVKKGFIVSNKQIIENPEGLNFHIAALARDLRRSVVRSAISSVANFKNIRSIPEDIASILSANSVATISSGSVSINDLTDQILSPTKLLVENMISPVMICHSKMINQLANIPSYGRLTNREIINNKDMTINLGGFKPIPFYTINNADYFTPNISGLTAGKVVAMLIDQDAYQFYGTSKGANLTQSYVHDANKNGNTEFIQGMYFGGAIVNPYKIAVLTVKA